VTGGEALSSTDGACLSFTVFAIYLNVGAISTVEENDPLLCGFDLRLGKKIPAIGR